MKRSKRMLALAALLAVVCAATFALSRYQEKQEDIRTSDSIILELPTDTVDSLSWKYADGEGFAFHRGDEGWVYDADEAFPVNAAKIESILSDFEAFGASFIIENADDPSPYGLEDPECVITLTAGEESYQIKLGDFSKMDQQRYVDIGDGNAYLVKTDPMDLLESELSGMIAHDSTPSLDNVTSITFNGDESYTITKTEDSSEYSYDSEDVYYADIASQQLALDPDRVSNYTIAISSLELTDYVTYNATDQELESYGLAEPELTVTMNYTYTDDDENQQSGTCVIHISQDPQELAEYEAALENEDEELPEVTKYVRMGDSQIVYKLGDSSYSTLSRAGYDDLRHREVIWADFETVTQIDITLEGQTHTITPSSGDDDEDEDVPWLYGEEEFDVYSLKSALWGLTANSFTDEVPTKEEEISLTVYLDNESFPRVDIQLYRYDGSQCLAVVDGETVSLLSRSSVMKLVEAVQAVVLN